MKIWQGGRQDGLIVVCNCLLVKGWNFPPAVLRVCRGTKFLFLIYFLYFLYFFLLCSLCVCIFFLGGGSYGSIKPLLYLDGE